MHTSSKRNKGGIQPPNVKKERFFRLLKGGDVPRIEQLNDLKNVAVMRSCCWYDNKKQALDTGLHGTSPPRKQASPEAKRTA